MSEGQDPVNLRVAVEGGVTRVELHRPERLNALSVELLEELDAVVTATKEDPEARVLILSGAGRAFCAGYDVEQAGGEDDLPRAQIAHHTWVRSVFGAFEALPVVKIAQVHGHCAGAGLLLACTCELRYAVSTAIFSVPELDLGLPFSMGGVQRLIRNVGLTTAADMVFNRTLLRGDSPRAIGLVAEVVEEDRLADRVDEVARAIAERPGLLLFETAKVFREAAEEIVQAQRSDLAALVLAQQDPECQAVTEAYASRFERRDMAAKKDGRS